MSSFSIETFLILVIILFYLVFTIRYFGKLQRSIIFTGRVKYFHLIMVWLVPFAWILLLKTLTKSTPGSYEVDSKVTPKPFSDNNDDAKTGAMMGH
jgi:hypothetical protein